MGVSFTCVMVSYAEFTNMIIARNTPHSRISNSFFLQLFGGGSTNSSGTFEDRMDRLIEDSIAYILSMITFSIIEFLLAVITIYSFNYSAQKKVGRLRRQFLKSIIHQEISWYDTQNTGAFSANFSDSMERILDGIGEKVGIVTFVVSAFVSCVIVSLFYGWKLTLVITAICPVFIIVTMYVTRSQTELTIREGDCLGAAGAVAEEVLSSIRTVVAYSGEDKEVERYKQKLALAMKVGIKSGISSGLGNGTSWALVFLTYALAFWYGTPLIMEDRDNPDGIYTPGVLMLILTGIVVGATNLGLSIPNLEAIAKGRGAFKGVREVIEKAPAIDVNAGGVQVESDLGDIEFKDVHFTYPARPDVKILKGLSFKVRAGESVALVGGSGSGKSTIIHLIERFYDPASGSVTINNVDLKKLDLKGVRRCIGLVGQEPVLFNMTIGENICAGLNVSKQEMEQAARDANAHDFISNLPMGYNTMVGERGAQLSGGQKQRIAIARALLRRPSVLLLDEATSALDVSNEAVVQSALEKASKGRTTITISHRLSGIRNVDRILVMANGRLVEEGTHNELMAKKGNYCDLVTADSSLQESSKEATKSSKKVEKSVITQKEADVVDAVSENLEKSREETEEASIMRIIRLNKPDWPYTLTGSIASLIFGCTNPASAFFFGNMYWALSFPNRDDAIAAVNLNAIGYIGISILAFICLFIQNSSLTLAGVRMTSRLRIAVFQAMLRQDIAWFDDERHSVGSLCAKLSGDTSSVQGATGSKLGSVLQAATTIGIGISISFFFSWKMTLMCLICMPFIVLSIVLEGRVIHAQDSIEKQALEEATKVAVEAINSVRTVQSLGLESAVLKRYNEQLTNAEEAVRRKTRFRGLVYGFGQSALNFVYGFALGFGGYLIARQGESYRNINIVAEALLLGAWMLSQVLAVAPNMQLAKSAAGRLFSILDSKPKITSTTTPTSTWNANGNMEYRDVHFAYPNRPQVKILQGLSLGITQGKKVALVGSSGCGKSTCVQLLQRFYDPDSGTLKIDGRNIFNIPLKRMRSELGIVSQEPVLFDRTIAENIAYGDNSRVVSMAEIVAAAQQANVHTFITTLPAGYDTLLGTKGSNLSGGQKQRIAIARALVRNPRILILDEATSALDSQSEKIVQEALDGASAGRTCIVIAHRLSTVTNADVICVLVNGVVVELGSHVELLAVGGHYARLLQSQQS